MSSNLSDQSFHATNCMYLIMLGILIIINCEFYKNEVYITMSENIAS